MTLNISLSNSNNILSDFCLRDKMVFLFTNLGRNLYNILRYAKFWLNPVYY